MKEYLINFDLFCFRTDGVPQPYRVYLDGDLITERNYIWTNAANLANHKVPMGQFVRENVWVNLEPGEHELVIEPLNSNFSGFYYKNLRVDAVTVSEIGKGRFIISE